jgi:hypothetical protein
MDSLDKGIISNINLGVTGAKRTSFAAANPKALAADICGRHPRWSNNDLVDALCDAIMEAGGSTLETTVKHACANFIHSALRDRDRTQKRPRANMANAVRNGTAAVKALVLLDLVMPNKKRLRSCTFSECAKFGSWLTKLSHYGGPKQIVGKTLTETQVRKVYASAKWSTHGIEGRDASGGSGVMTVDQQTNWRWRRSRRDMTLPVFKSRQPAQRPKEAPRYADAATDAIPVNQRALARPAVAPWTPGDHRRALETRSRNPHRAGNDRGRFQNGKDYANDKTTRFRCQTPPQAPLDTRPRQYDRRLKMWNPA